jgi:hypothetical protein
MAITPIRSLLKGCMDHGGGGDGLSKRSKPRTFFAYNRLRGKGQRLFT